MLRFEYLPSDFNPLFLFVGNSEELAAFSGVLRSFASQQRAIRFSDAMQAASKNTRLRLIPARDAFGMKDVGDGTFAWNLNAWIANEIANRVDILVQSEIKSGSDIFEIGSDDEIPVKVSKGEFTDDFLVTLR